MSTQQPASPIDSTNIPSGAAAGKVAGKAMPEGRRFSGERAKMMQRRSVQKRLENAGRAPALDTEHDSDRQAVLDALLQAAKKGNVQAAREWLTHASQEQQASEIEHVALEDMTPEQRQFALAYMERRIARAYKRWQGLQAAAGTAWNEASREATLVPKNGPSVVGQSSD